jgi:hypothetical protein
MIIIRGMYGFDISQRDIILSLMEQKIKSHVSNFSLDKLILVERPFISSDCTATYVSFWYDVDKQNAIDLYSNTEEPFKESVKRDLQILGFL